MAKTITPQQHDVAPVRRRPKQLPWPLNLYQTAVGKKYAMALTGIGLLGYVVVHMIGNMHLYEGPEQIYHYGEALRDLGGHLVPRTFILWLLRFGLIAMFAIHIHSAMSLNRMNMKANKNYAGGRDYIAANFASRTMRWTGPIILLYVFYHLADLTWGWTNSDYIRGDVYYNVGNSFANLPVAILYMAANIVLAIHIFHGAWSMFQSLGNNNPKYNNARRGFAAGIAGIILIGNLSFPIAVQVGLINPDAEPLDTEALHAEEAEAEHGGDDDSTHSEDDADSGEEG
jgi:succinate dehydrogenase / fumarate reductase cytochrome b subunit